MSDRLRALSLFLVPLLVLGCATTGVNKGDVNLITVDEEIEMGNQFAAEIAKQYPILDDAQVTIYFSEIGKKIGAQSDWAGLDYHFRVINTDDVNAFAIPGGHVYLHRGLIDRADNLSEVAGVMAHEISHVVARHGTEQLTKQYGLAIVAQAVLGENPAIWQQVVANLFMGGTILAYGRNNEHEADNLGVKYAYRAGYDPRGLDTFLKKLQDLEQREPSLIEKWLSTHPPTSERIKQVEAAIAALPPKSDLAKDDPEFHTIQTRLRSIPVAKEQTTP